MAIIRDKAVGRGATVAMFDPRKLKVVPSLNARDMTSAETREHVERLAESIAAQGFLGSHPLEVFTEGDEVFVAAGHCRLAACMLLIGRGVDIAAVPCLSEARGTSPAQRLLNQITSNTGQRLNLAEEGRVYHRLMAMGYIVQRIAKDAGRSESHVRQALDFNGAPVEAHTLVSEGKVSATLAAKTIRKEGPKAGVTKLRAAVERAQGEGKTKATARHVAPKAAPRAEIDPAACVRLVKHIARLPDPHDMREPDMLKALSRLIADAKAILAPAQSTAAE